jgi:hypothetical protein
MKWLDARTGQLLAEDSVGLVGAQKAIDWDSPVSPLDQIRDKGLLSGFYVDFTPAARELGRAIQKRESKAEKILARLRLGPANSAELAQVGGLRYSARIFELRAAGHNIVTEEHAEFAVYSLRGE